MTGQPVRQAISLAVLAALAQAASIASNFAAIPSPAQIVTGSLAVALVCLGGTWAALRPAGQPQKKH
jgi:hypothetical protein